MAAAGTAAAAEADAADPAERAAVYRPEKAKQKENKVCRCRVLQSARHFYIEGHRTPLFRTGKYGIIQKIVRFFRKRRTAP